MKLHKWGCEALIQPADQRFPELTNIKTTLLIAHARQASVGYKHVTTSAEAHPFFENGIYIAHNGTIKDADKLDTAEGTDTQKLLRWLNVNWTTRNLSDLEAALWKLLKEIEDYTAINLLITEGSSLYAFCCYRCEPEYYTLHYRIAEDLVIIASEPLDEASEMWQPMTNGELLEITPDQVIRRQQITGNRTWPDKLLRLTPSSISPSATPQIKESRRSCHARRVSSPLGEPEPPSPAVSLGR